MGNQVTYPRLLVITQFVYDSLGGAECLIRQLLDGYPSEQVSWWSCHSAGGRIKTPNRFRQYSFLMPSKLYPTRRLTGLKCWLLEKFWLPLANQHLARTIAKVQPETLWTLLFEWPILIASRANSSGSYRRHVSLWDYPDFASNIPRFGVQRCQRFLAQLETSYKQATTCDVISQPLLTDMKRRTGRDDAIILHSGLEPWQLSRLTSAVEERESQSEIRIAYVGTLHIPETVQHFIRAVEAIRSRLTRPLFLEFFGARGYQTQPWFNPEWMKEHEKLEEEQLYTQLRKCMWGLVLMDLTDRNPQYNRFSFPNKFGTCLAAGLPLLVLAHPESSAAKMMGRYKVGFCSGTGDERQLGTELLSILSEPSPKRRFQAEILRCADEEFNMVAIRRNLWRCLGVS